MMELWDIWIIICLMANILLGLLMVQMQGQSFTEMVSLIVPMFVAH